MLKIHKLGNLSKLNRCVCRYIETSCNNENFKVPDSKVGLQLHISKKLYGMCKRGQAKEAVSLYTDTLSERLANDNHLSTILSAISDLGDEIPNIQFIKIIDESISSVQIQPSTMQMIIKELIKRHEYSYLVSLCQNNTLNVNCMTYNTAISYFFNNRMSNYAMTLFKYMCESCVVDKAKSPSCVTFTNVIHGLYLIDKPKEALKLFMQMRDQLFHEHNIEKDKFILTSQIFQTIPNYKQLTLTINNITDTDTNFTIKQDIIKSPDIVLYTFIMRLLFEINEQDAAFEIFFEILSLSEFGVIDIDSNLIAVFLSCVSKHPNLIDKALAFYDNHLPENIKSDKYIETKYFKLLLDKKPISSEILAKSLKKPTTFNILLKHLVDNNQFDKAITLFNTMLDTSPEITLTSLSINIMLHGYINNNRLQDASVLFNNTMKNHPDLIDTISFNTILSGFIQHSKNLNMVQTLYNQVKTNKSIFDSHTLYLYILHLCNNGMFDEIVQEIRNIEQDPTLVHVLRKNDYVYYSTIYLCTKNCKIDHALVLFHDLRDKHLLTEKIISTFFSGLIANHETDTTMKLFDDMTENGKKECSPSLSPKIYKLLIMTLLKEKKKQKAKEVYNHCIQFALPKDAAMIKTSFVFRN